jgi:phospholysine phosphohistidine inorganic pyrophosphate phosphatase
VTTLDVQGLLVDLDGTLYIGDTPVEGAQDTLLRLAAAGVSYCYVTNTTRYPRRAVTKRLEALGFPEGEVFTPARAAALRLRSKTCHPLVAEELLEDLSGVRMAAEDPDCVLVGDLGRGFNYERLNTAFRYLMGGAELVALQKNRYWQEPDGLSLDAGPFVAALEYACGRPAVVLGKPGRPFFELALEELGLPASRVAMVGDDAEADVAGAQRAGLYGVQVETGKYRPGTAGSPDLQVASFARLPEALGL